MPGANGLYVGRNKLHALLSGAYSSPFLLEILSTRSGAPAFPVATGSLTANTGQVVSCSRAASAYCLGNDGLLHLLEPNSTNGFLQSNNFTTGWTFDTPLASAVQNQTDPFGVANNAWTLTQTVAAGTGHRMWQAVAYTTTALTGYFKQGTARYLWFDVESGNSAVWDWQTQTFVSSTGSAVGYSQQLTNGWWRIGITSPGSAAFSLFAWSNTNGTWGQFGSPDGSSVIMYGAQVEAQPRPTTYAQSTNVNGTHLAAIRVEPAGLLVEASSTNQCLWSQDMTKWTQTAITTTANTPDVLAPDGTQTATKIVTQDTTGATLNSLVNIVNGGTPDPFTQSVWLRTLSGTVTWFIGVYNGTTLYSKQVTVTNQWQRFTFTKAGGSGGVCNIALGIQVGFGTPDVQTGQPAATIYAWGSQVESLPFASSYIPTTTASATRDADVVTVANPLAGLSQPVPAWRVSALATPLPGFVWTDNVAGNFGNNALVTTYPTAWSAPHTWGLQVNWGVGHLGSMDVYDSAGTLREGYSSTAPAFGTGNAWQGLGTVTTVPHTTISPAQAAETGTGTNNNTQIAALNLGGYAGTIRSFFHLTDIYVDNT